MRAKWAILLCCLLLLVGLVAFAAAAGAEDSLLSVSYLYNTYLQKLQEDFSAESESFFQTLSADYRERLDRLDQEGGTPWSHAPFSTALELKDGGSLRLAPFGRFIFTEGTALLHVSAGEILDLSDGRVCEEGEMLLPGHRYFAAEESEALIRAYALSTGFTEGNYIFQASGVFPASEQFLDIGSHWGREKILTLTEAGLVNGMESHRFEPNRKVSRAMFVTVLGRYCGISADPPAESSFPDVRETDWFAPYVSWGADQGLVQGYDDGTFCPNLEITREQMALILVRYCRSFDLHLPETPEVMTFADEEQISFWALDAVRQAQRWGLVNGREDGRFDPQGTATRAEMCTIICNLMERSAEAETIVEETERGETSAAEEKETPEDGKDAASELIPPDGEETALEPSTENNE